MSDYQTIAKDFVEHLALKYEPVGVTLIWLWFLSE